MAGTEGGGAGREPYSEGQGREVAHQRQDLVDLAVPGLQVAVLIVGESAFEDRVVAVLEVVRDEETGLCVNHFEL